MKLLLVLLFLLSFNAQAYEIIEDRLTITNGSPKKPDASALLELKSDDKGVLLVRMTTVQRDAIASPASGLTIYNTDNKVFEFYNGITWSPVGGSGTASIINEVGHGRTIGPAFIPVYDSIGTWTDAKADSPITLATHIIIEVIDIDNFILAKVGLFPSPAHGLAVGDFYFTSSATAGDLTNLEPVVYSNPVIRVRDANTLEVLNYRAHAKIFSYLPGTVISVFGRQGAVVAQSGDYTWNQINKAISSIADITTKDISLLTGTLFDTQVAASNVTQHEGALNHDALLNFENNEHIDWTAVGAGVIDPSNYVDNDTVLSDAQIKTAYENNANTNAFTDIEQLKLSTIEAGATGDQTGPEIEAIVSHDNLVGYVANEHLDHSSINIVAGFALTGGGDLTASRTLNVDETQLDITNMMNYNANGHVDHSTVSIDTSDANDGLIGGGDITATRTLSVDITSLSLDPSITGNEEVMYFDIGTNKLVKSTMDDIKTFTTGGVDPLNFQDVWDANANFPVLTSGVGSDGFFYVVSVPGATNLDGITTWNIGDWALFRGGAWKRVPSAAGAVTSVYGRVGNVTAQAGDYTWAQINKATSSIADITNKSHTLLTDIGINTHAQLDTHLSNLAIHRIINDAASSSTELWSANKINTELGTKAPFVHSHDLTTDVTGILPIANGGTGSATQTFVDLSNAQTIAGAKTFSNDLAINANLLTTGLIDGRDVSNDGGKLDGIELLADVTDAINVAAAGAIMFATDFLDEDNMVSDSAIHVASQQSIKAYVDNEILSIPAAPVASVHSRIGAVVSANGDYTADQITNIALGNLTSVDVQSALNELQSDVDARELTIIGAATSITGVDLTFDRALISTGTGKVAVSAVTATELLNLSGLTSNLQSQLDTKVETASNLGGGGAVGLFKQKTLLNLEFKGINAGSTKISIIDDVANDEVDIDIVEANISHDNLAGFVANEHLDHSTISVTGQSGLAGGGTITANRTLVLDFNSLPTTASADADLFAFIDVSGAVHGKTTRADLNDNLVLFSATDTTKDYFQNKIAVSNGIQSAVVNPGGNESLSITPLYGTIASTIAEGNHTHDSSSLDRNSGNADLYDIVGTTITNIGTAVLDLSTVEAIDTAFLTFDAPTDELTAVTAGRYRIAFAFEVYCQAGDGNGTRTSLTRIQRAVGVGAFADIPRTEIDFALEKENNTEPTNLRQGATTFTLQLAAGDRLRIQGELQNSNRGIVFDSVNLLVEYLGP